MLKKIIILIMVSVFMIACKNPDPPVDPPGTNAELSNITVSEGTLNPSFNPDTTLYSVSVNNEISGIVVTGTLSDEKAKISSNNGEMQSLSVGVNIITLTVTAENNIDSRDYTVVVNRSGACNADLYELSTNEGVLNPLFSAETTEYTIAVENTVSNITITGTQSDPNAIISSNNGQTQNISVGTNTVIITVTAEDGVTVKDYIITIIRAASANADLGALTVSSGTLVPGFSPDTLSYSVNVDSSTKNITVTGEAAEESATLSANNGVAQPLSAGVNEVAIVVTAGDKITTKTYIVSVNVDPEHVITDTFEHASKVFATDLDNDGDPDVIGTTYWIDQINWWENDGSGNFTEHILDNDIDGRSIYAEDLDSDGDTDILLGSGSYMENVLWWENDGTGTFSKHIIDGSFGVCWDIHSVDLDKDGDLDVLGAGSVGNRLAWWENNGSEIFTKHIIIENYLTPVSIHSADMDSDGDIDIVAGAYNAYDLSWWENNGSQDFFQHTITNPVYNLKSVYAADLDNDGDYDVLGSSSTFMKNLLWWENSGSGTFSEHVLDEDFDAAADACSIDLDNDGDQDVLGAAYGADDIAWWENDGTGIFSKHIIDGSFNGASSVYAADFDGDGDLDVTGSAENANTISWWEMDY